MVLLGGCASVERQARAPTPAEIATETSWDWLQGRDRNEYLDYEDFLASEEVRDLVDLSEKYGYDPDEIVAQTWEIVQNVTHLGQ